MAPPEQVLKVDLYGSAVVFEEFERVIAPGGAGLIISSMAGHMMRQLPEDQEEALAYLPADALLDLQFLKDIPNSLVGYMVAKRANHLRVQSAAMTWGEKGARVNSISPGIIVTPLAQHELNSEIGDGYRAMIAASPSKRMAPPEEIAVAAAYLLGPDAGFVTGSDLLIDGGVIAARCRDRSGAGLHGRRQGGRLPATGRSANARKVGKRSARQRRRQRLGADGRRRCPPAEPARNPEGWRRRSRSRHPREQPRRGSAVHELPLHQGEAGRRRLRDDRRKYHRRR